NSPAGLSGMSVGFDEGPIRSGSGASGLSALAARASNLQGVSLRDVAQVENVVDIEDIIVLAEKCDIFFDIEFTVCVQHRIEILGEVAIVFIGEILSLNRLLGMVIMRQV
ncbi:MAG: hypothetical protein ACR2OX_09375, partial [Methyloligellaceae bacterium]